MIIAWLGGLGFVAIGKKSVYEDFCRPVEHSRSYTGSPCPQWCRGRPLWPEDWGMSKEQLRNLIADSRARSDWNEHWSVRDFVQKVVIPRTRGTGLGLAALLNESSPLRVNTMVSHAWEENAGRFFDDLLDELQDDEVPFVCFLALYQPEDSCGPYIVQQLGAERFEDSPFVRVISHLSRYSRGLQRCMRLLHRPTFADCVFYVVTSPFLLLDVLFNMMTLNRRWFDKRMIVVSNEELKADGCGLYSRLWCVIEVFSALLYHLPVEFTHRSDDHHLFGCQVPKHEHPCSESGVLQPSPICRRRSVRDARCGNPQLSPNHDELRIRAHIEDLDIFIWAFAIFVPIYVRQYLSSFYDIDINDFQCPTTNAYDVIDAVLRVIYPFCVDRTLRTSRRESRLST